MPCCSTILITLLLYFFDSWEDYMFSVFFSLPFMNFFCKHFHSFCGCFVDGVFHQFISCF